MSAEEHLLYGLLEQCIENGVVSRQCQGIIQNVSDRKTPSTWGNFLKRAKIQFSKGLEPINVGALSLLWILRQFSTPNAPRKVLDPMGKQLGNEILFLLTRLDSNNKQERLFFCEMVALLNQLGYLIPSNDFPLFESLNQLMREEKWEFVVCLLQVLKTTQPKLFKERKALLKAAEYFIDLDFKQPLFQQIAIIFYPHLLFASALLDEQLFRKDFL